MSGQQAAGLVFLVESRKDASNVKNYLRAVATTNGNGVGYRSPQHFKHLRGKRVVIPVNNNKASWQHALTAAWFSLGIAAAVKIVRLPKVLGDWLAAGHDKTEMLQLLNNSPELRSRDDLLGQEDLFQLAGMTPEELATPSCTEKPRLPESQTVSVTEPGPEKAEPNLLIQGFHDVGNSQRVLALHGPDLLFCPDFRKFLINDQRRFIVDLASFVEALVKQTMTVFFLQAGRANNADAEKFARSCLNANRIRGAVEMLKSEPSIIVRASDLDRDPWALNVLNGTINLRTGELREHLRGDRITKLAPKNFIPCARRDRYLSFLAEIMGATPDSSELELEIVDAKIHYLQLFAGYSATGDTSEKKVAVAYGHGDNGKSTLLTILSGALGDYAGSILIDTLMIKAGHETNNSLADLADLQGKRFVVTSEGEEGQKLAASKLKYLTQGMGTVRACRKYENLASFPACHKLWIDTNFRPRANADDQALWNRLRLIPFDVTIPKERRKKHLAEEILAEEAEGVLAWQREGLLEEPESVRQAGQEWHDDNDSLGDFFNDCFDFASNFICPTPVITKNYEDWRRDTGEHAEVSRKQMSRYLEKRGCKAGEKPKRIDGKYTRYWIGLAPKKRNSGTE